MSLGPEVLFWRCVLQLCAVRRLSRGRGSHHTKEVRASDSVTWRQGPGHFIITGQERLGSTALLTYTELSMCESFHGKWHGKEFFSSKS